MKNKENFDIGVLMVLTLVFAFIFAMVHLALVRFVENGQDWEFLVNALIASLAWLYWPRGDEA